MNEFIIPVKVPVYLDELNITIYEFSDMLDKYLNTTPMINGLDIKNWDLNPDIEEFYVLVSVPDGKEFNPSGNFVIRWKTDFTDIKELNYKERRKK